MIRMNTIKFLIEYVDEKLQISKLLATEEIETFGSVIKPNSPIRTIPLCVALTLNPHSVQNNARVNDIIVGCTLYHIGRSRVLGW